MIRDTVRDGIAKQLDAMLRKIHELNYERLFVGISGDLYWSESADKIEYSKTPYLANVGTGTVPCNCDECLAADPLWTVADYEFDADAYQYAEGEMMRALDEIGDGYFDDEGLESAAAKLGRKGGQAKSDAKTSAVRENGKKGGRPKAKK